MPIIPYIVGIAGGSCSGKTTLAGLLAERLPGSSAVNIGLDSYYHDLSGVNPAEIDHHNLDEPAALDHQLLIGQLQDLAAGKTVEKPAYDFAAHTRKKEPEVVRPGSFIIVEGLFALHWEEVRSILGTKVFVDVPHDVCLNRRIERDTHERGRTPDEVTTRYNETVRPMFEKHVLPVREYADVIANGGVAFDEAVDEIIRHMDKNLAG